MTEYRIPLVDATTKLFPAATVTALQGALDFTTSAEVDTQIGAYLTDHPVDVDTQIADYLTANPPESSGGWVDDPDNPGYLMPS